MLRPPFAHWAYWVQVIVIEEDAIRLDPVIVVFHEEHLQAAA